MMIAMGSARISSCRVVRGRRITAVCATVIDVIRISGIARIFAIAGAFATIAVVMGATPAVAMAQDFAVDAAASDALTNYLRQNRLPLVGAQLGSASAGARRLVLYGYVATQMGKTDAETKAIAYLGSPRPEVINRIVIQPEIAKMRSGGRADDQSSEQNGSPGDATAGSIADYASGAPSGAFPGQSFDKVVDDIQRYGVKSPPDDGGP